MPNLNPFRVTRDTTEDEATALVKARLERLVHIATDYHNNGWADLKLLANVLNEVAEAQGEAQVRNDLANLLRQMSPDVDEATLEAEVTKYTTRFLAQRTDDTSSGRTNDVMRAYNDGVKREVTSQVLMRRFYRA